MQPVHALLGDRNDERDALQPEPVGRALAAFVERERRIDRVPMILHHPARAVLAAGLLVGVHHHLDAAPQLDVLRLSASIVISAMIPCALLSIVPRAHTNPSFTSASNG